MFDHANSQSVRDVKTGFKKLDSGISDSLASTTDRIGGDSVTVFKDLKVKGSSLVLEVGANVRN